MTSEQDSENWWNTSAANKANRLIDIGRGEDMGRVVPSPEGHEDVKGITWVSFDGVVINGIPGAILPIETQKLVDAGIDPGDGDPLAGGIVFFRADVAIEVDSTEEVAPTDFKAIPKLTSEDVAKWEADSATGQSDQESFLKAKDVLGAADMLPPETS